MPAPAQHSARSADAHWPSSPLYLVHLSYQSPPLYPFHAEGASFGTQSRMLSCSCWLLWGNMNWTPLCCQNRLTQPFTERRMWVNRLNNFIRRQFIAHGYRIFRNQVRRIWTDDMRTQNLVVLAQNDFGEALGMGTAH